MKIERERQAGEHDKQLFERMTAGLEAEYQCEEIIPDILGIELLGISFDAYDKSIEIYPELNNELNITDAQVTAIFALGCMRFWIFYEDGTAQYAAFDLKLTKRTARAYKGRWNNFKDAKAKCNHCKQNKAVKKADEAIAYIKRLEKDLTYLAENGNFKLTSFITNALAARPASLELL